MRGAGVGLSEVERIRVAIAECCSACARGEARQRGYKHWSEESRRWYNCGAPDRLFWRLERLTAADRPAATAGEET